MKLATAHALSAMESWEDSRTSLYGPLPINYLTALRLELDLSHLELARRVGLTKNVILRVEQGTYKNIPGCLLDFWSDRGINEHSLTGQYEAFQAATREHYFKLFGDDLYVITDKDTNHPLKQLRAADRGISSAPVGLSVMQVSKYLCVPQSPLQYWETRWRLQKSVPKDFALALQAIGYDSTRVNHFCTSYEYWRRNGLG